MVFIAISNYLRVLIFAILLSFAEIAELILAKICHLKVCIIINKYILALRSILIVIVSVS